MAFHDSAIIGYAETKIVDRGDRDVCALGAEILGSLIKSTGVEKGAIDGLILSSAMSGAGSVFWSQLVADALGLGLNFCQTVDIGGCSPLGALARATMAIDAGLCENVLCLYADTQSSADHRPTRPFRVEWTSALGYLGPPAAFGLLAQEYERRYGLDRRHLNRIAELNYGNARRNPLAQTRKWNFDPLAFTDDDEANPVIEPGTRRQDCGQITDGACAVVLASSRFAQEHMRKRGGSVDALARIAGWGHRNAGLRLKDKLERSKDAAYVFPHLRQAIEDTWRRAGVQGIDAMDGVETHDCFTTTEYMAIDHLGLTAPGQSWQAVEDGRIERGGSCPINMSGGLIGCGHPVGATGTRLLFDAARQVTGTAGECQIEGARRLQTLNIGGSCATVVSFVLACQD